VHDDIIAIAAELAVVTKMTSCGLGCSYGPDSHVDSQHCLRFSFPSTIIRWACSPPSGGVTWKIQEACGTACQTLRCHQDVYTDYRHGNSCL